MSRCEVKQEQRQRRKKRVRRRVFGTTERPRLTVFRSLKHVYAQVIDDGAGVTLAEASSRSTSDGDAVAYGGNIQAATTVGKLIGERAVAKGVSQVVFDRNGYRFHGRLKALANAAREAGLKF